MKTLSLLVAAAASFAGVQGQLSTTTTLNPSDSLPCRSISGPGYPTIAEIYECFDYFDISEQFRTDHVGNLIRFFEMYPYTDLNVRPPEPLFQNNVDVVAELEKIAANSTITKQFDLYSRIWMLLESLRDHNIVYMPSCISTFTFNQPWHMAAEYPGGATSPVIKLVGMVFKGQVIPAWENVTVPGGLTLEQLVGYTVLSVDGVPVLKAIQDYAATFSGKSRTPESRFNNALYSRFLEVDGIFGDLSGSFYSTPFLGRNARTERTYVLSSPSGSSITVTVPWIGSKRLSAPFVRRGSYWGFFCTGPDEIGFPSFRGVENDVDMEEPVFSFQASAGPMNRHDLDDVLSPNSHDGIAVGFSESTLTESESSPMKLSRRGTVSLSSNITPMGENYGFYMMDDGITGMFLLQSFGLSSFDARPNAPSWVTGVTEGLRKLEEMGAKRLLVDVSLNSGMDNCAAEGLVEYLLPGTASLVDQFRLTPVIKTLLEGGLLDLSKNATAINATSILTETTRKDRGAGSVELSSFFKLKCEEDSWPTIPKLKNGWLPENIAIVSDGLCGGACSSFVRSMRDGQGVKFYVYGGYTGIPFSPTSFESSTLVNIVSAFIPTTPSTSILPTNFTVPILARLPVTQKYSLQGPFGLDYPAEWVPKAAETFVQVEKPYIRTEVWEAVRAVLPEPFVPVTSTVVVSMSLPTASTGGGSAAPTVRSAAGNGLREARGLLTVAAAVLVSVTCMW
ncbi:hypothetical protein HDU67_005268 [Dinochytrium kinnereticum]|nr:hypothetical protein HDU67_005268 [Dinochytrium kinnereticum]